MVIKKSEMQTKTVNNMKDGEGSCKITPLCSQDLIKHSRMFSHIEVLANSSIGIHTHLKETEYYYILEGTGTVNEKDSSYTVSQGDLVITGDKESHSLINNSDKSIKLIALVILD